MRYREIVWSTFLWNETHEITTFSLLVRPMVHLADNSLSDWRIRGGPLFSGARIFAGKLECNVSLFDRMLVKFARSIYGQHSSRSIVKITVIEGWCSIAAARRVRAARSREKGLCRDNPKRGRDAWLLPIYVYLCLSRGILTLNGDRACLMNTHTYTHTHRHPWKADNCNGGWTKSNSEFN